MPADHRTPLDRAAALVLILAERAATTEARRHLLPETIADLKAAGFTPLSQPKRFGGAERPLNETAEVFPVRLKRFAIGATRDMSDDCAGVPWTASSRLPVSRTRSRKI